jgi:hypothetical protein
VGSLSFPPPLAGSEAAAFAGAAAEKLKAEAAAARGGAGGAQVQVLQGEVAKLKAQNQQLGARLQQLCHIMESDLLEKAFAAMTADEQQAVNKQNVSAVQCVSTECVDGVWEWSGSFRRREEWGGRTSHRAPHPSHHTKHHKKHDLTCPPPPPPSVSRSTVP